MYKLKVTYSRKGAPQPASWKIEDSKNGGIGVATHFI